MYFDTRGYLLGRAKPGTCACQDTLWLVKCRVLGQWCKPSRAIPYVFRALPMLFPPSKPGADDHINGIID